MGEPKECREIQPRTPLWKYMEKLREEDKYESLKIRFANHRNKEEHKRRSYYQSLPSDEDDYEEEEMDDFQEEPLATPESQDNKEALLRS